MYGNQGQITQQNKEEGTDVFIFCHILFPV